MSVQQSNGPGRPRRVAPVPGFRQPADPEPTSTPEEPTGTTTPATTPEPWSFARPVQRDLPIPKPDRSATLTGTSATSDVDPKLVAGLLVALVGVGVTAAAVVVKRTKRGRKLRRPTGSQIKAFVAPVADILLRHMEIARLSPTLVDALAAVGAVGAYVEDGPFTMPDLTGDPGQLPQIEDEEN